MTTTGLNILNAAWLRQVRGWCGILLMVVSLCGGFRSATVVTEETSPEQSSELLEYAHRLADGGQRSLNRRARALGVRPKMAHETAGTALPCSLPDRRNGQTAASDHVLANGLRAPLHC